MTTRPGVSRRTSRRPTSTTTTGSTETTSPESSPSTARTSGARATRSSTTGSASNCSRRPVACCAGTRSGRASWTASTRLSARPGTCSSTTLRIGTATTGSTSRIRVTRSRGTTPTGTPTSASSRHQGTSTGAGTRRTTTATPRNASASPATDALPEHSGKALARGPSRPLLADRDAGGESRIRDHELAVHLERPAAASLVEKGEDEGGHGLAADVLGGGGAERLLEERLDVDAVLRRVAEQQPRAAELPVGARDRRRFLRRFDTRGDRRPALGGVEERQLVGAVADDRDAERLQHLGGRGHVEKRLGARRDHQGRRAGELREVGGDVRPPGEATVDAADPAGAHETDPSKAAHGERAADRRRSERTLRGARREISRPGCSGLRAGLPAALDLLLVQADDDGAVDHADGRGHGAFEADRRLRGEPHLHPHPGWETVCDQRSLERDHRAALVESLLHFRGDLEQLRHGLRPALCGLAWGGLAGHSG